VGWGQVRGPPRWCCGLQGGAGGGTWNTEAGGMGASARTPSMVLRVAGWCRRGDLEHGGGWDGGKCEDPLDGVAGCRVVPEGGLGTRRRVGWGQVRGPPRWCCGLQGGAGGGTWNTEAGGMGASARTPSMVLRVAGWCRRGDLEHGGGWDGGKCEDPLDGVAGCRVVPEGGLEPPWSTDLRILSPLRLPIPPLRLRIHGTWFAEMTAIRGDMPGMSGI
jgi:hypothetical protein